MIIKIKDAEIEVEPSHLRKLAEIGEFNHTASVELCQTTEPQELVIVVDGKESLLNVSGYVLWTRDA